MNCARMKVLLVDYAEDSLAGGKKLAVERHLSRCESCRRELSILEELKGSLRSLPTPDGDDDFWENFNRKLAQKLANEKDAVMGRRRLWLPGLSFGATVAVAVLLLLSLVVIPRSREQQRRTGEIAPAPNELKTVEVNDLEVEPLAYSNDEMVPALAELSSDEMEYLHENAFLLVDEGWESTDDIILDYGYERSINDLIDGLSDDLSLEEYEEVYEELISI